ncbi:MAG: GNAT family N-acetyltransferase, partial [Candidatus Binatia bacterium]
MSAIEVRGVDRAAWDDLVRPFREATVFHRLAWLDTLSAVHGYEIVLAEALEAGRRLAVWPALQTRKGPLRVIGSPLPGSSTTYMGPLIHPDADPGAVIEAFLRHEPFRRAAYLACRVIDRERPVNLTRFGFSMVKRFPTYWIDLTRSEERLWSDLKSECRSRIRKAQKLGLEVRREEAGAFVDDFWKMSVETFARSRTRPTYTHAFVRELWNRLHGGDEVLVLSAFLRGERIATLVLPMDDHALYYWGGASFQRHRALPSHNLLHWEAILEGKRRKLAGYDLISTNGGPGRFKRTFGPREVPMATHWERSSSRWTAVLKGAYEQYRRRRLGLAPRAVEASDDDDRVRVVHVISGLRMGGAETMLYKLLSHSDRREFASEVVSLTDVGVVGERIGDLGVRVRSLGLRSPAAGPAAVWRL